MSFTEPILLVGGAGFIGCALAKKLVANGYEVHVLSRHRSVSLPEDVFFHHGNQNDRSVVLPLLEHCGVVVHLAGATIPADTVWQPVLEVEENLIPTLQFLECAQSFPARRYIFLSTGGALYGEAMLADESKVPRPLSYHGAGKLALEAFLGVLAQRHSTSLTILRPSNVYGPGQSLRMGFGAVRTLLERAKDGGIFTLFGDGGAVRDYLYLDDFVDACMLAMNAPGGIYNIGSGKGCSLIELLRLIEHITGRQVRVDYQPARASDVGQIVLDIRRANQVLGWQPVIGIKDGVTKVWQTMLK